MKYNYVGPDFLPWLAGFIDADGCFNIRMGVRKSKVEIGFSVFIGVKGNDGWVLEEIRDKLDIGKVYYSNKGKPNEMCRWQVYRCAEVIQLVEAILPYLRLKKEKAITFLEIAKRYYEEAVEKRYGDRSHGPVRPKELLLAVAEVAVILNYDRQTERYRNFKGFPYWQRVINEMYSSQAEV